jgi:hypothetical protein
MINLRINQACCWATLGFKMNSGSVHTLRSPRQVGALKA